MLTKLLNAVTWPATAAHEATHYAVGRRWAAVRGYSLHPLRERAWVDLAFRPDCPRWARVLASVAPTIVGTAFAAVVVILLAAGGGEFPAATREPGVWLLAAAYWLIYTAPSRDDLRAAQRRDGDA